MATFQGTRNPKRDEKSQLIRLGTSESLPDKHNAMASIAPLKAEIARSIYSNLPRSWDQLGEKDLRQIRLVTKMYRQSLSDRFGLNERGGHVETQ